MSIWTFDTADGADLALRTVERLQLRGTIAVADAAVVAWAPGSHRPRTYQVGSVEGTAALSGAFWGLVFGTVFLLPITGRDVPAGGELEHLGLSDDLVGTLRERVVAGRSALFLVVGRATVPAVASALAPGRPEHWEADVAPDHRVGLWRVFADDPTTLP
ncbi:DUF1269 domain-containing protein [Actinomycetospora sp. OC33-EN08]|uniref:DUF1269 domain-containing protein n=1 Tax=Actinomycetospora aurantiaca TaxID=3129233 RepID=A0ABU8MMA5_9PSEU